MIAPVERLEHHDQAVRFKQRRRLPKDLDAVGRLVFELQPRGHLAHHHRDPLGVDALRDLDRGAHIGEEGFGESLIAAGEGDLAEGGARIEDEYPHRHPELRHFATDPLLLLDGAAAHPVVLQRPEAALVHPAQLSDHVVAGIAGEHPEVRRELHREHRIGSPNARREGLPHGQRRGPCRDAGGDEASTFHLTTPR